MGEIEIQIEIEILSIQLSGFCVYLYNIHVFMYNYTNQQEEVVGHFLWVNVNVWLESKC